MKTFFLKFETVYWIIQYPKWVYDTVHLLLYSSYFGVFAPYEIVCRSHNCLSWREEGFKAPVPSWLQGLQQGCTLITLITAIQLNGYSIARRNHCTIQVSNFWWTREVSDWRGDTTASRLHWGMMSKSNPQYLMSLNITPRKTLMTLQVTDCLIPNLLMGILSPFY